MMKLFIIIVAVLNAVRCLESPQYLWPLGGDTFTFNVKNGQDGSYPRNDECFTVGPSHPSLSFSALYFDRASNSYADVRIANHGNLFKDFGFSVFFNSKDGEGMLFHYRSDNQLHNNYITEIYVRLANDKVITSIDSPSGGRLEFPTHGVNGPYPISLDNWFMVSFSNTFADGLTRLYLNTLKETYDHPYSLPLSTPGTLRFGAPLPPLTSFGKFKGFLSCGGLFKVATGFDVVTDILDFCSETNWPIVPVVPACQYWFETTTTITTTAATTTTVTTTTTAATTTSTPSNPPILRHFWPLDNITLFTDTVTSIASDDANCPRFFEDSLNNKAVYSDGSVLSTVILAVNGSDVFGNFSLISYIFPTVTSGVLLQIVASSDPNIQLIELRIDNNDVILMRSDYPNVANCSFLIAPDGIVPNAWNIIGMQRNEFTKKLSVVINGMIHNIDDTCGAPTLSEDLHVQIGSSKPRMPGFIGSLQCLAMFDKPFADFESVNETLYQACYQNNYLSMPVVINSCDVKKSRNRNHILFKGNVSLKNWLQPLLSVTSRSVSHCAVYCFNSKTGRSFTFDQSTKECLIYDVVTDIGMTSQNGVSYYIISKQIIQ